MRLNLVHWVMQLLTTDTPQIRGMFGKHDGRCALGLCMDEMVKINPNRWEQREHSGEELMLKDKIMDLSTGGSINNFLGITDSDSALIVRVNDQSQEKFKDIGVMVREHILTDDERKLLSEMEKEASVVRAETVEVLT